jgi:hypothetical protein
VRCNHLRRWAAATGIVAIGLIAGVLAPASASAISTTDLSFSPAPVHGVTPAVIVVKAGGSRDVPFRVTNRSDRTLNVEVADQSATPAGHGTYDFGPSTKGVASHFDLKTTKIVLSPHGSADLVVDINVPATMSGDAIVTAAAMPATTTGVSVVERLGILIRVTGSTTPVPAQKSSPFGYIVGGIAVALALLILMLLLARRRRHARQRVVVGVT